MTCIGVYDESTGGIKVTVSHIKKILKLLSKKANIIWFVKEEDVIEYVKENEIDIVFLDINMKKMNGIVIAHKLLEKKHDIIIIFVTKYGEYALDAFEANAMAYLMKPVDFNKMKKNLARAFFQVELIKKEQQSILVVTEKNIKKRIEQRSIQYIEKQKNQCIIYKEDEIHKVYESLAKLNTRLDDYFWQINQGVISNKGYIKQIVKSEVFLKNGIVHTLGRKYCKDIKDKFYQIEFN